MRRDVEHLRVTPISSANPCRFSRPFVLCVLIAMTGITLACGTASQANNAASNQATGQIAVSFPVAAGMVGVAYNSVPSVSGGAAPYLFVAEGPLPPGITLNSRTGSITGVPTVAGDYNFNLLVVDPPRTDHG